LRVRSRASTPVPASRSWVNWTRNSKAPGTMATSPPRPSLYSQANTPYFVAWSTVAPSSANVHSSPRYDRWLISTWSGTLFLLPRAADAEASVRDFLQAGLGDLGFALLALAERPALDAVQGLADLFQLQLLVGQQVERVFLLEVVRAQVRHVDRHVG